MSDESLFNASICNAVVVGHCVMLTGDLQQEIAYAGPIKTAPSSGGKLVLLNVVDFEKLKTAVDRGRH